LGMASHAGPSDLEQKAPQGARSRRYAGIHMFYLRFPAAQSPAEAASATPRAVS